MKRVAGFLFDILFPSSCAFCGTAVLYKSGHFCSQCQSKLKAVEGGCTVCSGKVENGRCLTCSDRKFYPDRHISLYHYDDVSKSLMHALKFKGLRDSYKVFVPRINDIIKESGIMPDIITFVPMNRKKLVKRGYNQSQLIAEGVGRAAGIEVRRLLLEKRNVTKQRSLNYYERFINVIDRYETVNNNHIRNRAVLLIDDVFTTGATVNECARVLRNSGAAAVFTMTAVRSDFKRLENI